MDEPISWESGRGDVLRVIRWIRSCLERDCARFGLRVRFIVAADELDRLEHAFGAAYLDRITAGPSDIEGIRRSYAHSDHRPERGESLALLELFEEFVRRIYRECRGEDPRW